MPNHAAIIPPTNESSPQSGSKSHLLQYKLAQNEVITFLQHHHLHHRQQPHPPQHNPTNYRSPRVFRNTSVLLTISVSSNQDLPHYVPFGFITMGYKQTSRRGSDNWERSPQVMVAHKLMAVEVDWRREKETLLREIKRLRSEVGLMTRRCNNSRREIYDMVTRLRAQPPPPVPRRSVDIRVKEAGDNGYSVMKSVESEVKEEQDEQGKKKTVPMPEPTPEFVPDPETVPKFEPDLEHVPNSELKRHYSSPKHSPTRTPPAPAKQEERYRLSKERMLEFGTAIANGGGAAAVDACAERWMLVWMKFCMYLAEGGKDGEAVYGQYKGEQEWDDQVIKWWNGMKDDLRSEVINDGNDMPELIKVVDVDKADRMCWKMKFVKGVNVNLEGNDMVLRVGEV